MLRITCLDGPDATHTLKLEGKLVGPWVAEVLLACDRLHGRPGETSLDLAGITFADRAGANLLGSLIRKGVRVSACSGFVAELLHLEKS
jgi:ABC-type transporter Mla MlaB component